MKSAAWKRKLCPFQWTNEPPSPVPGRKLPHRRIGSAVSSDELRKVTASFTLSCIIPLRIEKRSSSWMAGDWKSGTVKRGAPRSMPTTFNPVLASSNAIREPVKPTPIVTTSTGFRRSAIFGLQVILGVSSGDARIHVYAAVGILADTGRCSVDLDAVLIDHVVVRSIGSGKADHPPCHHVAVAAVDRIAEEAFKGA